MSKLILALTLILSAGCIRPNTGILHHDLFAAIQGPPPVSDIPTGPSSQMIVAKALSVVDMRETASFLTKLTEFPDRYFKSANGVAAAEWIYKKVLVLQESLGSDVLLTVQFFNHTWRRQPSVVARLESRGFVASDIVITGSHFDTIAYGTGRPEPNPNPGADDCASGSSVVFEALRSLVVSGFVPKRPIEFHWYAGEEEGVYGSNEVANSYAKAKDQTGYVKPGSTPQVGMLTDYASRDSTDFLKTIVKSYSREGFATASCGYPCTDNSAWYSHGYKAAALIEGSKEANGDPLDTLDVINWAHLNEFIKVTIGFVIELSLAK